MTPSLNFLNQCSDNVTCQLGVTSLFVLLAAILSAFFIPYKKLGTWQPPGFYKLPERPGPMRIIVAGNVVLWGLLIYWLWM